MDEWTPESIIKLGTDVNMRSIHEEELSTICVGSSITWCNPNYDVMLSITLQKLIYLYSAIY